MIQDSGGPDRLCGYDWLGYDRLGRDRLRRTQDKARARDTGNIAARLIQFC